MESGAKCMRVKGHVRKKKAEAKEKEEEGDRWLGLEYFMDAYANVTVKGSF